MSETRTPRPDAARVVDKGGLITLDWRMFFEALDRTKVESYDPDWDGSTGTPTLGNGSITGTYVRIGSLWLVSITLVIGSTTSVAGTGDWSFQFPKAMSAVLISAFRARDAAPAGNTLGWVDRASTTRFQVSVQGGNYLGAASPIAAPAAADQYEIGLVAHE